MGVSQSKPAGSWDQSTWEQQRRQAILNEHVAQDRAAQVAAAQLARSHRVMLGGAEPTPSPTRGSLEKAASPAQPVEKPAEVESAASDKPDEPASEPETEDTKANAEETPIDTPPKESPKPTFKPLNDASQDGTTTSRTSHEVSSLIVSHLTTQQPQDSFISSPLSQIPPISPNTSRFGFTSLGPHEGMPPYTLNDSFSITDRLEMAESTGMSPQEEIDAKALEQYPETSFGFKGIYHGARRWGLGARAATKAGENTTYAIKLGTGVIAFSTTLLGTAGFSVPVAATYLAQMGSVASMAISIQQGDRLGAAASLATMFPSGTSIFLQTAESAESIKLTTALAGMASRTGRSIGAAYSGGDALSRIMEGSEDVIDPIGVGDAILTVANR
jgi:hypothetical protein